MFTVATCSYVATLQVLRSAQKYCRLHGIPYSYSIQIKRYIERERRRFEFGSHMQLLRELPDGMVRELFQEARSQTLHYHAFFKDVGLNNYSMEVDLCSEAVSEIYLLAGDVAFDAKKKGQGMYIMSDGLGIYQSSLMPACMPRRETDASVKPMINHILPAFLKIDTVTSAEPMPSQTLELGEHIAEPALWVKSWRHRGKFQALLDSRLLLVSAEDLFSVLQEHSEELVSAIVYARLFLHELNNPDRDSQVTDLPIVSRSWGAPGFPTGVLEVTAKYIFNMFNWTKTILDLWLCFEFGDPATWKPVPQRVRLIPWLLWMHCHP